MHIFSSFDVQWTACYSCYNHCPVFSRLCSPCPMDMTLHIYLTVRWYNIHKGKSRVQGNFNNLSEGTRPIKRFLTQQQFFFNICSVSLFDSNSQT